MSENKIIVISEDDLRRRDKALLQEFAIELLKDQKQNFDSRERLLPHQLAQINKSYKVDTIRNWIKKGKFGKIDFQGRMTATINEYEDFLYNKKRKR